MLTEYWINGNKTQKFADQSVYEDPNCSNSMGPMYTFVDHFLYFDVDLLICYLNQPAEWLAIPANGLQPIGSVPPLPQPISDFLGANIGFTTNAIGPLLGR